MTVCTTLMVCPIEWRNQSTDRAEDPFLLIECNLLNSQIGSNSAIVDVGQHLVGYRCYESDGTTRAEGKAKFEEILSCIKLNDEMAKQLRLGYNYVPLFLRARLADTDATFSCTASHGTRMLFLNTGRSGAIPLPERGIEYPPLSFRDQALSAHAEWRLFLNNHNNFNFYKKFEPDNEIEFKFNMVGSADIWRLAISFSNLLEQGTVGGFAPHFTSPITHWDFENHMFEVISPMEERGYVSFIPTPNGTYIVKRKVYQEDALVRKEYRQRDVKVPISFEAYLEEHFPTLVFRRMPSFRRIRYDVDFESLTTGNIYSVMFDRSTVVEFDFPPLIQCEIEYIETRSCYPPRAVMDELKQLKQNVEAFLVEQHVQPMLTYCSKLTYLKECITN